MVAFCPVWLHGADHGCFPSPVGLAVPGTFETVTWLTLGVVKPSYAGSGTNSAVPMEITKAEVVISAEPRWMAAFVVVEATN